MMEVLQDVFAVILAGGSGTRFWPKSRQNEPKQFCKMGNSQKTLLELSLDRLDGIIPPERRILVTHERLKVKTKELVGNKLRLILSEPEAKNTAAALSLAALEIERISTCEKVVMMSFHADQLIENMESFKESLITAHETSLSDHLVLLGIVPNAPETGYGYIERGEKFTENNSEKVFQVNNFKEKPELQLAKKYLNSPDYYWNSGIFIWKVSTYLNEMKNFLPRTIEILSNIQEKENKSFSEITNENLSVSYKKIQNISIDHALLELSSKTLVVEADFSWKDVGSWGAMDQCFPTDEKGNFLSGEVILVDSENCTIDSDGPLIAALGLRDLVIVSAKGAILVCPKERSQEVKSIVSMLSEKKSLNEYL